MVHNMVCSQQISLLANEVMLPVFLAESRSEMKWSGETDFDLGPR